MEVTLSDDLRQQLSEAVETLEQRQIAQTRVLSQMLKQLKSISTYTYGASYQCGEIANMLGTMMTDLSVVCAKLDILVEHLVESVEKEDA